MRKIEEIKADIAANHMRECRDDQPELWEEICAKHDELRLEYYETILHEISFDRLEEFCRAEKDGLCKILPCKVGSTVWVIWGDCTIHRGILSAYQISCPTGTHFIIKNDGLDDEPEYKVIAVRSDFGKTVFLTREEAENALHKHCYDCIWFFPRKY